MMRKPRAHQAGAGRWVRSVWPAMPLAGDAVTRTVAAAISCVVSATTGSAGRRNRRAQSEPQAQHPDAASVNAAPREENPPLCDVNRAMSTRPIKPSALPQAKLLSQRDPRKERKEDRRYRSEHRRHARRQQVRSNDGDRLATHQHRHAQPRRIRQLRQVGWALIQAPQSERQDDERAQTACWREEAEELRRRRS